jgi:putrescine aminotransferase
MVGLMGALEIVKDKDSLQRFDEKQGVGTICRDHLINNGLCLRPVGDTIVCAPPLVLSHAEADELVDVVWKSLDLTQQTLSAK